MRDWSAWNDDEGAPTDGLVLFTRCTQALSYACDLRTLEESGIRTFERRSYAHPRNMEETGILI